MYQELGVPSAIFDLERVTDWEKRIEGYSESVKAKYRLAFEKQKLLLEIIAQDKTKHGWKNGTSDKKKKMYAQTKYINGLPMMRSIIEYPYDALTCFRCMGNIDYRLKYERGLSDGRIIGRIGVNFMMGYQRTYRILTVSPRDVYIYGFLNILEDGRIICTLYDEPEVNNPEESGCVRMTCFGGMVFTPDPVNPNKCRANYVMQGDLKGMIPQYVTNQVMNQSAQGLSIVYDLLPKYVKEFGK